MSIAVALVTFAAEQSAADPYSLLLGLGPVGVIAFLLIIGKLRTEGEVKRLEQEVRAKDEKINSLTESVMGQVIPLMVRVTAAMDKVLGERPT